jgi:hypothetical protein
MPGFVKTPRDDARWKHAVSAVERSKGKKESEFGDRDFALSNYIYHKMGKGEEDIKKAEELQKALVAPPKPMGTNMSTSVPNPAKTGQTGVRTPKPVKMAAPDAKPSEFFKAQRKVSTVATSIGGQMMAMSEKIGKEGKLEKQFMMALSENEVPKHPSVRKLRDFLQNQKSKAQGRK